MLKIIIVAVMVGIGQGGERNLFVFTEPSFNTVEECVSYVQNNVQEITGRIAQSYGFRPVEQILCAEKDKMPVDLIPLSDTPVKRESI
tara:strand:+ start:1853 stop:2116 length:264 start_codon:yes stop_codon:yes gene_type:complete